jgi:hypothetical protein
MQLFCKDSSVSDVSRKKRAMNSAPTRLYHVLFPSLLLGLGAGPRE